MSNEFKICDDCRTTNVQTLLPKLKEVDPDAEVVIGCHSYCGIGHKKLFAIVNGRHVTATSEDELVDKVEKAVKRGARRRVSSSK